MKRHGDLWEKIVNPNNLYRAYRAARRGKGWRRAVKGFERNINGNLLALQKLLCTGQFNTAEYKSRFVYEPKKREIYTLPFYPDRIAQHALIQVVGPIWDGVMIYDSYACREGKGMHEASRKTMSHVRQYKYCLKADISKFYPSIDHEILLAIIRKKIKCKQTLALIENIVRSYPGGKNTPIGNYTSQWFGNLYMNELDAAIKQFHCIKPYIRYCDDFVVFSDNKAYLHSLKLWIEEFLSKNLMLRFSKWSIFPVSQGVDFLGYRHFPQKVLLRKSTATRVKRRMRLLPIRLATGKITLDEYRSSIASTEGWLRWANTFNFRKSLNILSLKGAYA